MGIAEQDRAARGVTARARVESGGNPAHRASPIAAMPTRRRRWSALSLLGLAVACHDGVTPPDSGIDIGESFAVTGAQSVKLEPGASDGDYVAVVVNAGITAGVD